MASRVLASRMAAGATSRLATPASRFVRNFQTSPALQDASTALPARKPVGAFRGGLLGFFAGSTLAGAGVYTYLIQEYKVANELLTEDIYTLQQSVHRVSEYVQRLEEKMEALERRKK